MFSTLLILFYSHSTYFSIISTLFCSIIPTLLICSIISFCSTYLFYFHSILFYYFLLLFPSTITVLFSILCYSLQFSISSYSPFFPHLFLNLLSIFISQLSFYIYLLTHFSIFISQLTFRYLFPYSLLYTLFSLLTDLLFLFRIVPIYMYIF